MIDIKKVIFMSNSGMRNMTEGSVARHLVLFALPMFAGSVLQQL